MTREDVERRDRERMRFDGVDEASPETCEHLALDRAVRKAEDVLEMELGK